MAKKKVTTVTKTVSDGDEEIKIGDNAADEITDDNDIISELRAFGVDAQHRYNVFKISGKAGSQLGHCATMSSQDFSLDGVRDTFGGGKYRITVTDDAGKIRMRRNIDVVESLRPLAPVPTATLAGSIAELAPVLELIRPPQQSNDILLALIKSQGEMLTAMMNRPAPATTPPMGVADFVALMTAMKGDKQDSPIDVLLKGLSLGKEIAGDGGGDSMMTVASKGLEMIGELAKHPPQVTARPRANVKIGAIPPAELAGTIPAQPPKIQPTPASDTTMAPNILQQLQWLRQQLTALIYQANRGSDPSLYADVMLDNLPPYITVDEINQHIGAPTAIDELAKIDARVLTFRDWFEEFRRAVIESLSAADEEIPPGPEESDQDEGELT